MQNITINIKEADGHEVFERSVITGKVHPHNTRVQVLVFSADDQWYLQKDAEVDCKNGKWKCDCAFGNSGVGNSLHVFTVVAVAGGDAVKTTPVSHIPSKPAISGKIHVARIA